MSRSSVIVRALRCSIALIVVALGIALLSGFAHAADNFPGSTISGSTGTIVDTTTGMTSEAVIGEPATIGGGTITSQWYSWTAPSTGLVVMGTCNSTTSTALNNTQIDSVLAVFTGVAVGTLTAVVSDDDGCVSTVNTNYASILSFNATAGTIYRIQVDSYASGTQGQFVLNWGYVNVATAFTVVGGGTSVTEGGATSTFTVAMNTMPSGAVTVTLGTSPNCTFSPSTLNFGIVNGSNNWPTAQTVTVTATNNAVVDGTRTCTPATITATGGGFTSTAITPKPSFTVYDNDALVTIANGTAGSETGPTNATYTVTQSGVSGTATVVAYSVSGTAIAGTDYTAPSGSVTILAGSTTATITIPVLNDAIVEPSDTLVVTLTSITSGLGTLGATLVANNTIADNDSATVSIANTTNGAEATPTNGVMTVTQTAISSTNTVIAYSVGGTATSGSDYTALTGSVTIPAGSNTATISIPVVNDAIVETSETVTVTLTSISSGLATLSAAVLATNTIADDDVATVSIASTTNGAEAGPGNGVLTVTQTAASATNTVLAYSVSGTATSGTDFTALSGTVTILAGAFSNTIAIPVLDDAVLDPSETVIVTLTSVTTGLATLGAPVSATNTITDNEAATVTIANTTQGAETGPVNGVMTVTQTLASPTNTVIAYTVGGTATSGSDFTALSGTVTITAGLTTAIISIPVINDAIAETGETVIVTLTSVTSGFPTLGATLVATNTIADNDSATVSIANTTNGAEAGPINGVITLTQTAQSATDTVIAYSVSGTAIAGTDYTALSGTITILASSTNATISIPVLNDLIVEPSDTVIITLTSITSGLATLSASVIATNTIADNDTATVSIANTTNGAEAVAPTNGKMTLTQTAVSVTNTVIAYSVAGTATSGSDYTALSGSVTILAGFTTATITIPVIDNLVVEPSETVAITLTSISSGLATLGSPLLATNTITDNDVAAFTITKAVNLANISSPSMLNYTITIASTGNVPLTAPILTDALSNGTALTLTSGPTLTSGDAVPLGTLDAGETWTYTATYAVTQANINNGASITNSATFDTAETAPSTSNTLTTAITQNPHLKIIKSVNSYVPRAAGSTIIYTYTILNDGNLTMTNVSVTDTHNGSGTLPAPSNELRTIDVAPLLDSTDSSTTGPADGFWDSLAPGDTIKFTTTYTVTQHDVDYLQ